jgi:hypothetical protein
MLWIRSSGLCLAGALILGAYSAQGQDPSKATFSVPFTVPVTVGFAHLKDSTFVVNAEMYRYAGDKISGFDLYVWPLPQLDSLKATVDSLLRVQVDDFKVVAPIGIQRGWYDNYVIAVDAPHRVPLSADSLAGYVVAMPFKRRGQVFASFFYIYALKGMFVKIRLTVPEDGWNDNPALDLPAVLVRSLAESR